MAMIVVAEVPGIERFDSPRALAAYLGLVPTLYASGDPDRRGKTTNSGKPNSHLSTRSSRRRTIMRLYDARFASGE